MKKRLLSVPIALVLLIASALFLPGCLVETCTDCTPPPPPCTTCNPPPPPCTWGPNGVAGPAYFGLDWTVAQPTYVWTNNTAIPPVFRYGDFYNSLPGTYRLYYEGRFQNGCCMTDYHWQIDFVVWVNAGTAGGCGFAGADGLPSSLMLVCGPDGPGQVRTNKYADQGVETTVISENATESIVEYSKGDIHVRVSYHRLAESKRKQLSPSGVIRAEK